jgi:hypothetical protein
MNISMRHKRWPALLVLAALALGTVAPVAEAGNGNGNGRGHGKGRGKGKGESARVESTWRRSGGDRVYARDNTPRRTFREWNSRRSGSDHDRVVVRRESRPVYRDQVTYRPRTVYRESYRPRTVYRDRVVERPVYRSYRTYRGGYAPYGTYTVWRRSGSGAVFAGFVGGLFLGATLANACPVGFAYYDPYCHESFLTLSAYYSHCNHHHHARTIRVIEIADGYDYDDYHYCDDCDDYYWGDDHDC